MRIRTWGNNKMPLMNIEIDEYFCGIDRTNGTFHTFNSTVKFMHIEWL